MEGDLSSTRAKHGIVLNSEPFAFGTLPSPCVRAAGLPHSGLVMCHEWAAPTPTGAVFGPLWVSLRTPEYNLVCQKVKLDIGFNF